MGAAGLSSSGGLKDMVTVMQQFLAPMPTCRLQRDAGTHQGPQHPCTEADV